MTPATLHWTERSIDDYQYKVATDFVLQLSKKMEIPPITSQKHLAKELSVSTGRVSQVFNDPGNLSLRSIIKYARALGQKVAIVVYDDNDPGNERGPINSEIFQKCWNNCGSPKDFFDFDEQVNNQGRADTLLPETQNFTVSISLIDSARKQDSTTKVIAALYNRAANTNYHWGNIRYAGNRTDHLYP